MHSDPILSIEIEAVEGRFVHFTMLVMSHVAEEKCAQCIDRLSDYIENDFRREMRKKLKRYIGISKKLGVVDLDDFSEYTIITGTIDLVAPLPQCKNFHPIYKWEHDFNKPDLFQTLDDGRMYLKCTDCGAIRAMRATYSDRLLMRTRRGRYWDDDYCNLPYLVNSIGFLPRNLICDDLKEYVSESSMIPEFPGFYTVFFNDELTRFDLVIKSKSDFLEIVDYLVYGMGFISE